MKTIRYIDPTRGTTQLGVLQGSEIYSISKIVPQWTDPVPMWYALRALGLSPDGVVPHFTRGEPLLLSMLQQKGLLLPPIHAEEVWAAGVTYERSRVARNAETQFSDSVYDSVYESDRPELFFKATAKRVTPPGQPLGLRTDSAWMVPEPELCLILSCVGEIIGWTVGNDLSSRDIEGANPLYLPQAKIFSGSCSVGPVLLWNTPETTPNDWNICLDIIRNGERVYSDTVPFSQFRRSIPDLISYLMRNNTIPDGTVLMTGTGLVPPDDFTLQEHDAVYINIDAIGTLCNVISSDTTTN